MSKEKRVISKLRRMENKAAPSGVLPGNLDIPNHSGDHRAGKQYKTPSDDYDIVNKKYVDDNAFLGTISSFGASLIDDADAGAARTTLGLGTFAVLNTSTDNGTNDTEYVPLVLHGTDATPPTASTVPIGSIYIQYTP